MSGNCGPCGGTGQMTCTRCGGSGKTETRCDCDGGYIPGSGQPALTCSKCNGSQWIRESCSECMGAGGWRHGLCGGSGTFPPP
jgi:hypothetical protein